MAYAANLNIGGSGGSGGSGDSVSVSNSGSVRTLGVRAHGVLAQSIGGGGGSGGSVVTQPGTIGNNINADLNQWVAPTISANIGLGGSGGVGGSGGALTLANSGSVATAGYGAIGLLAQSIGGGGGTGADGSTGMGISIQLGGNGGSGNNGGAVQLGTASGPLTGSIATVGDDAHAVLAQSIGGGGGWASGICSNSASGSLGSLSATRCIGNTSVSASVVPWSPAGALSLNMPGSNGNSGDGGAVSLNLNGAIQTAGARSMGLVAQSIGGGGGFVSAAWNSIANASMLTQQIGQSYASGGSVAVTLGSGGSISTSGDGAWGLLAQSIGGGGGFLGDPSLALLAPVSNSVNSIYNKDNNYANAGAVAINLAGSISTTGSNAHGVVAQSIGGGGGIAGGYRYDPAAQVVMGNAYQFNNSTASPAYSGAGNSITITQTGGTINTTGSGSIGILAQSSGGIPSTVVESDNPYLLPGPLVTTDVNPYLIKIAIAGTVSGGSGTGAGIVVSGGGNSSTSPNTITINNGGLVTSAAGVNGTAILANSGTTNVTIESGGTVTGSVDLGATPGDMTTDSGGTFNAGPTLVVASNTFTNAGNLFVAGPGRIGATTITGGFAQAATGVMGVDINALAPQANDQLVVKGNAQVGGTIVPVATALLPGSFPVVSATSLSSTAQVRQGIAFGWRPSVQGNTLLVTPLPTFRPVGFVLSPSQRSLTGYLDRAWIGQDRYQAQTFGYLSQLTSATQYRQVLRSLAPQAHTLQMQHLLETSPQLLGSTIECPNDLSTPVTQTESHCLWAKVAGSWDDQSAMDGDPAASLTGVSTRLGGQWKVASNWFVGAGFGYGQSWSSAENFSSQGEFYEGSLSLRYVRQAWTVSGSLAVASGSFQNNRRFFWLPAGPFPASGSTYTSSVNPWTIGGRLRVAYTIPQRGYTLRPYVDLDLIHAEMPAFQEFRLAGIPLSFQASPNTAFLFTPMLEFGGQSRLDPNTVMRFHLAMGMSFRPGINWIMNSQFSQASNVEGVFQLYGNAPEVVARLNLGLQLFHTNGFDLRLGYDLSVGGSYLSQVPSAKLTYRF
ncbi:MAG: autotransporter domain-containing protein [Synechococcaceae cyanobacterium]